VLAVRTGFLIRNTAGGIAAVFGIVAVLPLLANALPHPRLDGRQQIPAVNARHQILNDRQLRQQHALAVGGLGVTALYAWSRSSRGHRFAPVDA